MFRMQILDAQFRDIEYRDPDKWSHVHLFGVSEKGQSISLQVPFGSEIYIKLPPFKPRENLDALLNRCARILRIPGLGLACKPSYTSKWAMRPYTRTKIFLAKLQFRSSKIAEAVVRSTTGTFWPIEHPVHGRQGIEVFESGKHVSPLERFSSTIAGACSFVEVKSAFALSRNPFTTRSAFGTAANCISVIDSGDDLRHLCMVYSIETSSVSPSLPDEATPESQPSVLMISYVVTDSRGTTPVVTRGILSWKPLALVAGVHVESFASERAMLARFETLVKCDFDADILVCYDSAGFAFNYISQRAKFLGLNSMMNMGKARFEKPQQVVRRIDRREVNYLPAPGRVQFDTCDSSAHRGLLRRGPVELACAVLPEGHPGRMLSRTYLDHAGAVSMFSDENRVNELAASCLAQSETTHAVFDAVGMLNSAAAQAKITLIPMQTAQLVGRQAQLMTLLLSSMREAGVVLSIPHDETLEAMYELWKNKIAYSGGKNLETKNSILSEPVFVLDFSRMYPSLQRLKNVCASTVIPRECLSPADAKFVEENKDMFVSVSLAKFGEGKWKDVIVCQDEKRGFLPLAQKKLWDLRTKYKDLQNELKAPGDARRLSMLRACEIEAKVAANAMYGLLGMHSGGRAGKISNVFAAATVTHFGQVALDHVRFAMTELDSSVQIVFGDTDSIAIWKPRSSYPLEALETPESMRAHMLQVSQRAAEFCTERVAEAMGGSSSSKKGLVLAVDKCLHPMMLYDKKKRYMGISWPGGVLSKTGGGIVSRSTSGHLKVVLEELAHIALGSSPNRRAECLRVAKKACLDVAMGKVAPMDLACMEDIKTSDADRDRNRKENKSSKSSNASHVAGKKRSRGDWTNTGVGSRISFVHVIGPDGKPCLEDDAYADAHRDECPLDLEYYVTNHYASKIEELLAPLGITGENVVGDALLVLPGNSLMKVKSKTKKRKLMT